MQKGFLDGPVFRAVEEVNEHAPRACWSSQSTTYLARLWLLIWVKLGRRCGRAVS